MSKASVNRHLALLRAIIYRARDAELIPATVQNPVSLVKFFREHARKEYFELDEILSLIGAAARLREETRPGSRWYMIRTYFPAMVALAAFAGLRLGEILSLRWDDLRDNRIDVRAEMAKNGVSRVVPVSDVLHSILSALVSMPGSDLSARVIPVRRDPSVIRATWRRVKAMAGVNPQARFHSLRHSFASHLIRTGVDPATIRDLMGHSSLVVTGMYTHSGMASLRAAVNQFALPPEPEPRDKSVPDNRGNNGQ